MQTVRNASRIVKTRQRGTSQRIPLITIMGGMLCAGVGAAHPAGFAKSAAKAYLGSMSSAAFEFCIPTKGIKVPAGRE
jgi:hypothetical protein